MGLRMEGSNEAGQPTGDDRDSDLLPVLEACALRTSLKTCTDRAAPEVVQLVRQTADERMLGGETLKHLQALLDC